MSADWLASIVNGLLMCEGSSGPSVSPLCRVRSLFVDSSLTPKVMNAGPRPLSILITRSKHADVNVSLPVQIGTFHFYGNGVCRVDGQQTGRDLYNSNEILCSSTLGLMFSFSLKNNNSNKNKKKELGCVFCLECFERDRKENLRSVALHLMRGNRRKREKGSYNPAIQLLE